MSVFSTPRIIHTVSGSASAGSAPAPLASTIGHSINQSRAFSAGTPAAGEMNLIYSAAFSVATGTPLVLDLSSLLDPVRGSVVFLHINDIFITNDDTVAGHDLTIGGGTAPLFAASPNLCYAPGGYWAVGSGSAGIAVNASTAHNLQIAAAAGTVTGKITIIGRSN